MLLLRKLLLVLLVVRELNLHILHWHLGQGLVRIGEVVSCLVG